MISGWIPVLGVVGVGLFLWPSPHYLLHRVNLGPPPRSREPKWIGVQKKSVDPFAEAASFDLFAVCLKAGMPTAVAAEIVAKSAPHSLRRLLQNAADSLALGGDVETSWKSNAVDSESIQAFVQLMRRTAKTGSTTISSLTELAEIERATAATKASAAGERANVAIAGPLGICFLPAFICLGIIPVIIGLSGTVLRNGII